MPNTSSGLTCVIFVLLITSACALNPCGGERDLKDVVVGEICDAGGYAECPFGTTTCSDDLNAILCVPNCSITVKMVLELNDTIVIPMCENGGHWDFFAEACVCIAPFHGGLCQLVNDCHEIDCNGHGTCVSGACVCDSEFTGSRCESHKNCRSFNLQWTGSECICAKGWTGADCDQCINTTVCVPNKNKLGYAMFNILDDLLRDALLETPPPQDWTGMQPYKPTPDKFQCQCTPYSTILALSSSSLSLIEGIADMSRINRQKEVDIQDSMLIHPYIEAFYGHKHKLHTNAQHKNSNTTIYLVAGVIILLAIPSAILYYLYSEKSHPKKRSKSKKSPTQPSFAPTNPLFGNLFHR